MAELDQPWEQQQSHETKPHQNTQDQGCCEPYLSIVFNQWLYNWLFDVWACELPHQEPGLRLRDGIWQDTSVKLSALVHRNPIRHCSAEAKIVKKHVVSLWDHRKLCTSLHIFVPLLALGSSPSSGFVCQVLPRKCGEASSCKGRYAPPESTKYTQGKLFSMAICCALKCFFTVMG